MPQPDQRCRPLLASGQMQQDTAGSLWESPFRRSDSPGTWSLKTVRSAMECMSYQAAQHRRPVSTSANYFGAITAFISRSSTPAPLLSSHPGNAGFLLPPTDQTLGNCDAALFAAVSPKLGHR